MSNDGRGPSEPEQDALRAVLGFYRLSRRFKSASLPRGLTWDRFGTLSIVMEREPVMISAISTAEDVAQPTASRAVAALQARGLVRCIPNRDDGRSVLVASTAKGRAMFEESALDLLHEVLALLGRLEAKQLQAMMRAIQRVLDDQTNDSSRPSSPGDVLAEDSGQGRQTD